MGIGRAGKTTLSNMIKNTFSNYNLIHSDSLKMAIIRAKKQEKYYFENVKEQQKLEHSDFFQKTLLEFFLSSIRNDKKKYGYILESGQLHPKLVKNMIDFDNTIVICLGLGNLNVEDMINQCIKYDKEGDWTYGLSRESLREYAENWYRDNEMLKKECSKYQIKYFDTSKSRMETLNKILDEIIHLV